VSRLRMHGAITPLHLVSLHGIVVNKPRVILLCVLHTVTSLAAIAQSV
jgi:hypothetical protein